MSNTYVYATHLATSTTYVLETSRKGSRKVRAYCLSARGKDLDVRIELRKVPLEIRRAMRTLLNQPLTTNGEQQ